MDGENSIVVFCTLHSVLHSCKEVKYLYERRKNSFLVGFQEFFPLFFLDIPSSVFNPVCPYVRESRGQTSAKWKLFGCHPEKKTRENSLAPKVDRHNDVHESQCTNPTSLREILWISNAWILWIEIKRQRASANRKARRVV